MTDTTQADALRALTPGRLFCLREVSKGPRCTWPVCKAAADAGLMQTWRVSFEWADRYFLYLRKRKLIERTGGRSEHGRSVHRITDAGRAKLAEVKA